MTPTSQNAAAGMNAHQRNRSSFNSSLVTSIDNNPGRPVVDIKIKSSPEKQLVLQDGIGVVRGKNQTPTAGTPSPINGDGAAVKHSSNGYYYINPVTNVPVEVIENIERAS